MTRPASSIMFGVGSRPMTSAVDTVKPTAMGGTVEVSVHTFTSFLSFLTSHQKHYSGMLSTAITTIIITRPSHFKSDPPNILVSQKLEHGMKGIYSGCRPDHCTRIRKDSRFPHTIKTSCIFSDAEKRHRYSTYNLGQRLHAQVQSHAMEERSHHAPYPPVSTLCERFVDQSAQPSFQPCL